MVPIDFDIIVAGGSAKTYSFREQHPEMFTARKSEALFGVENSVHEKMPEAGYTAQEGIREKQRHVEKQPPPPEKKSKSKVQELS